MGTQSAEGQPGQAHSPLEVYDDEGDTIDGVIVASEIVDSDDTLADDDVSADFRAGAGDFWREDETLEPDRIHILSAADMAGVGWEHESAWGQRASTTLWRGGQQKAAHRRAAQGARVALQAIALLAFLGVVGVAGYLAATRLQYAGQVTLAPSSVDTSPQEAVGIFPPNAVGSPTPAAPDFEIGAWVTTSTPPTSGAEQVFVRVTHAGSPVANASVTLDVDISGATSRYGPLPTDSYGIALFTVVYSGAPSGRPIYVTATATQPLASAPPSPVVGTPRASATPVASPGVSPTPALAPTTTPPVAMTPSPQGTPTTVSIQIFFVPA